MTNETVKSPFYILFVDDEENARKYFDKGLKTDFNVFTAGSVDEAIQIINDNYQKIAVVITDQRMPGGNGVILLKFLKENYPHIIRLLTTAYSDLSEAIEAVNGGEILRYIQKPWDFNMLKAEVRQALELFELRQERSQIIHEKIMVKKRMGKVERVKSLMLFAKYFSFLNSSEVAVANFAKEFVGSNVQVDENSDWKSFDLGSSDVLEVKFLSNFLERVQKEISPCADYSFKDQLNSAEIKSIFDEINQDLNPKSEIKILSEVIIQKGGAAFKILMKKLAEISATASQNHEILLAENADKISFKLSLKPELDLRKNNILIASADKNADQIYIDLISCYLLSAHHGGITKLSESELEVILPKNSNDQTLIKSYVVDVDDLIVSSML